MCYVLSDHIFIRNLPSESKEIDIFFVKECIYCSSKGNYKSTFTHISRRYNNNN